MEMILQFNSIALLLFSSFILLLLIHKWRKSKSSDTLLKLAPSPPRLPLIGHLHHLSGGHAHELLRKLSQKYGPVMHMYLGEVPTVVISSREAAKEVLKVQDPACAGRPESIGSKIIWYDYQDIVFAPYSEYWREMRKICILGLLSAKNVKSFASIRKDELSHLLRSIRSSAGEPINLSEKVMALIGAVTSRAAFGKVMKDRESLVHTVNEAVTMAAGLELADLFPSFKVFNYLSWNKYKMLRMRRKIDKILDVIVDEHKKGAKGEFGGEDIVDMLLRVQRDGEVNFPITNDNVKAIIFDMFSAGSETSSTTINWIMALLMKNPRVMAKAQAEVREAFKGKTSVEESDVHGLKYIKYIIKETLRLYPAAPLVLRSCRDKCTVEGYTIPLNSKVIINTWSLSRDPKYWDEPETFLPERFENSSIDFLGNNYEFIPFGAGRRICPGINFAVANVEFPLATLLYYFDWKMPQGMSADDIDMTGLEGIAFIKKNPVILVPTVHDVSI